MKFDVSNKAQEELKKIMEKKNATDKKIRIYVSGFG